MPPPLPDAIKESIIADLKAGVSYSEIESKYDVSHGAVSGIAKENGLSRKLGRKRAKKGHKRKPTSKPAIPCDIPFDISKFDPEDLLSLIDAGLTTLMSILPSISTPGGMRDWATALDKLIEKKEAKTPPDDSQEDWEETRTAIVKAVDNDSEAKAAICAALEQRRRSALRPGSSDLGQGSAGVSPGPVATEAHEEQGSKDSGELF
ncbi:MAG: hypothetical protein WC291_10825 [Thermodesulfovibrionales bacterium]|jgi:hypothetical protein